MKKKLTTKISNIEDIAVSVEYFKEKYYPDILKETVLLENIVNQIKLEPRILYDENYVKGWKDDLTIERESKVKVVINLLHSVLNELEDSKTALKSKKNFERWNKAKNWLKAIFNAASSGSASKLVYFGLDAEGFPSDAKLLSEFNSLKNKLERFFIKYYPNYIDSKKAKNSKEIFFLNHINPISIDEALSDFASIYSKSFAPYTGVVAAKDWEEVDTIDKIVLHILANKYRTTFQSISVRIKLI